MSGMFELGVEGCSYVVLLDFVSVTSKVILP